jgi:hypothetical protein
MIVPQANDVIRFKEHEEDSWHEATVISRAGKQTSDKGLNKLCVNVKSADDGKASCINLRNVNVWEKIIEKDSVEEANVVLIPKKFHDEERCIVAKAKELKNFDDFDVYEVVRDEGQNRISCIWILSEKTIDGQKAVKARLVARGFEEIEDVQSDSPTCSKDAFKIFLAIAASKSWNVESTDIKSAFLQGQQLSREVFVVPPKEAGHQGYLWRLKKCMYGLNDAPRKWYLNVSEHLKRFGCVQTKLDPSVFVYKQGNKLLGLVLLHVDDFLHIGNAEFYSQVMDKIRSTFSAGKIERNVFRYVGLDINQQRMGIHLSQSQYIEKLELMPVSANRRMNKSGALNRSEQTQFRHMVGQINWAAQQTRPDLVFEVMEMSMKLKHPEVQELIRANKAIKKLQSTDVSSFFPILGDIQKWYILTMSDAAFANLADSVSSGGGHVILLVGEAEKCAAISWKANKIKRVIRSTLAAEALALQECIEHAVYLRELLKEMLACDFNIPIEAWIDSANAHKAVHSTTKVEDQRLRIDIACIKESVLEEDITVNHCPGNEMIADCLTKRGANSQGLLNIITTGSISELFNNNRQ